MKKNDYPEEWEQEESEPQWAFQLKKQNLQIKKQWVIILILSHTIAFFLGVIPTWIFAMISPFP